MKRKVITLDDVRSYRVDWNKWHDCLIDSVNAFGADDMADYCKSLNIGYCDDNDRPVIAGDIYIDLIELCTTMIKLQELSWDGNPIEPSKSGFNMWNNCTIRRSKEGILIASYKFKSYSRSKLFDPEIEVRLERDIDDDNENYLLNIQFVVSGQFF